MKPNKIVVAERIKKIREDSGLSIANVAERLGISKSTLNSYIRGLALPPEEIVEKIAQMSDVSSDWIYHGTLEQYIYNYLIFQGNEQVLNDFPELLQEILSEIQKYSEDNNDNSKIKYPHPITIEHTFNKISRPIYEKFVHDVISEFAIEVIKYPLYTGTPKYNSEKYINRVFALINQQKPTIKYGETDKIYEIAKNEFENRVKLYKESKTKIKYSNEDAVLNLLEEKLQSDEGAIELISGLIHYFELNQKTISSDTIELIRSLYPQVKRLL
ncbi:helix-turn-helix domain-containing protein [Lysinibacillus xylanilyticus]|uniref:helix-turn-helix domain-containing protein n=1 Tax=Lysinibacillus xylanilyticus TaxID=582475 RepID=UPI003CFEE67E